MTKETSKTNNVNTHTIQHGTYWWLWWTIRDTVMKSTIGLPGNAKHPATPPSNPSDANRYVLHLRFDFSGKKNKTMNILKIVEQKSLKTDFSQ